MSNVTRFPGSKLIGTRRKGARESQNGETIQNGGLEGRPPTNGSNRGLIITIVSVGVGIMAMFAISFAGIYTQISTFQSEASADRRALQESMNKFQTEMLRLSERQAYLEGRIDSRK